METVGNKLNWIMCCCDIELRLWEARLNNVLFHTLFPDIVYFTYHRFRHRHGIAQTLTVPDCRASLSSFTLTTVLTFSLQILNPPLPPTPPRPQSIRPQSIRQSTQTASNKEVIDFTFAQLMLKPSSQRPTPSLIRPAAAIHYHLL